ncbi:hypothetical protein ACFE04_030010 [Oxalis oulophora]
MAIKGAKVVNKKKRKRDNHEEQENVTNHELPELSGIPITRNIDPNTSRRKPAGVIFILENAVLEVAKIGKNYELLNRDDHGAFLMRNKKDPSYYRPDICHHALLSIWDSTIAMAGRLRVVYIKTQQGSLIEVKPNVKIPRTYNEFSRLMVQLLQKLSITGNGTRGKLLHMIKNPVTQYLPPNSRKIGFSYSSDKLIKIRNYVDTISSDTDLVFVVGAMSHGKIQNDYTDDCIAISSYNLSAAFCIKSICLALADKWDIL